MKSIRIILTILFLSVLVTPVFAAITVVGDQLHVDTAAYTVLFDRGTITRLHNKRTGETHTLPLDTNQGLGKQTAILSNTQHFEARWDSEIHIEQIDARHANILFRRGGNQIRLSIAVDPTNNDLLIGGEGVSEVAAVYAMQWCIENLDSPNLNLIIPSNHIGFIEHSSDIGGINLGYPGYHWEAQLAIVESERGGFYVRGTDTTFRFKELNYQRDDTSFGLAFRTMNQAPWDTLTSAKSVTWRFNTYAGEWCVPAQIYRDWMEAAFKPWRLSDMPEWVRDIGLVVMHPAINKDFLAPLAQQVDPTKTLIYMGAEWRKYGHDVNDPDFTSLHENFEGFVDTRPTTRISTHAARQHSQLLAHPSDFMPNSSNTKSDTRMASCPVGDGTTSATRNGMPISVLAVLNSETCLSNNLRRCGTTTVLTPFISM